MLETERLALFKIFLLNILFASLIFAESYPDKQVDSLLKSGIKCIMDQNYDQAEKTFLTLDQNYPSLPLGKLYLAANLISKSGDFSSPLESDKIDFYLRSATVTCSKLKDKNSIWTSYFWGLVKGYSAYFEFQQGKWFSSFTDAINAVNYFENCLKIDPKFNDAQIAIGTYKYWKSVKAGWIPFFTDETDEGLKYLEEGIEKESYNYPAGVVSLLWIYINQKQTGKAIQLGEESLRKYPKCRNFKMILARAYEDNDLNKAITLYNDLLHSYEVDNAPNRVNEVIIKHKMAQDFERLKNYQRALNLCDDILFKKKYTVYEKKLLDDRLERVIALRKKMNTLIKDSK